MKELLKDFLKQLLYEPQHGSAGKVTDKALTRSIIISALGIVFCMACLFGLTWAWFSDSVVAPTNKITAATFELDITVTEGEFEDALTADENGYYTLEADKSYTVSLAKQGTAKTGFCLILVKMPPDIESATAYYTESIPKITEATGNAENPLEFTVFANSNLKIKFTPMWGTCPAEQSATIKHGEELSLGALASALPKEQQNNDLPEKESAKATEPPAESTSSTPEEPKSTLPQQPESVNEQPDAANAGQGQSES